MKLIETIFSIKNIEKYGKRYKQVCFLGLKFRKKLPYTLDDIDFVLQKRIGTMSAKLNRAIQKNISIAYKHQETFLSYKNINKGKDVYLLATGPTLNYFKGVHDGVYVGCNSAFKNSNFVLNYLFMQDYEVCVNYIDDVPKYVDKNCEIFYGYTMEYHPTINKVIPDLYAEKHNAKRYYTDWTPIRNFTSEFAYDISTQPLGCFGSIAFPTLQFVLWTNPKRIFLVGCDCSSGHYDNSNYAGNCDDLSFLIAKWEKFKIFAQRYYPNIEIISINPVGLKGLFNDIYTQEYLNENPNANIEQEYNEGFNADNKGVNV